VSLDEGGDKRLTNAVVAGLVDHISDQLGEHHRRDDRVSAAEDQRGYTRVHQPQPYRP
jgi:hypothetical protein